MSKKKSDTIKVPYVEMVDLTPNPDKENVLKRCCQEEGVDYIDSRR